AGAGSSRNVPGSPRPPAVPSKSAASSGEASPSKQPSPSKEPNVKAPPPAKGILKKDGAKKTDKKKLKWRDQAVSGKSRESVTFIPDKKQDGADLKGFAEALAKLEESKRDDDSEVSDDFSD
ncbi:unnamed protein product, partial [Amoebophrya sp. A25]